MTNLLNINQLLSFILNGEIDQINQSYQQYYLLKKRELDCISHCNWIKCPDFDLKPNTVVYLKTIVSELNSSILPSFLSIVEQGFCLIENSSGQDSLPSRFGWRLIPSSDSEFFLVNNMSFERGEEKFLVLNNGKFTVSSRADEASRFEINREGNLLHYCSIRSSNGYLTVNSDNIIESKADIDKENYQEFLWAIYTEPFLSLHKTESINRCEKMEWHNKLMNFFHDKKNHLIKPSMNNYYYQIWEKLRIQTIEPIESGELTYEQLIQEAQIPLGHRMYFKQFFQEIETLAKEKEKKLKANRRSSMSLESLLQPNQNIRDCLENMINIMNQDICGRDLPIRLMLLALLSQNHILLIGPPGTAKSALANSFLQLLSRARSPLSNTHERPILFKFLLTKMTTFDEIFGPVSLKGYEKDIYQHKTQGYLPNATLGFLDEIGKSSSHILNGLLSILNERIFNNGKEIVEVPLRFLIGATNEYVNNESLQALYDRFLFHIDVSPIIESNEFISLLQMGLNRDRSILQTHTDPLDPQYYLNNVLSLDEMLEITRYSSSIPIDMKIMQFIEIIQKKLRVELQCEISDRRFIQLLHVLQVSAACHNRTSVNWIDCFIIPHVLVSSTPNELTEIIKNEWIKHVSELILPSNKEAFEKEIDSYVFETKIIKDSWKKILFDNRIRIEKIFAGHSEFIENDTERKSFQNLLLLLLHEI